MDRWLLEASDLHFQASQASLHHVYVGRFRTRSRTSRAYWFSVFVLRGYLCAFVENCVHPIQELLAALLATRHFRPLVEGRPFTPLSQHKPDTCATKNSDTAYAPRRMRRLAFSSEFAVDAYHVKGMSKQPVVALSRVSHLCCSPPSVIDIPAPARYQDQDQELKAISPYSTSLILQKVAFGDTTFFRDTIRGTP